MSIRFTDAEIDGLVKEPKLSVPGDLDPNKLVERCAHRRGHLDVAGFNGTRFAVHARRSSANPLDFTAILGVYLPNTNTLFRLRRYNGRHWHRNKIEGERFRDFHIHYATQRYQARGFKPDGYATPTDRFATLEQALACLFADCAFTMPPLGGSAQPSLFDNLA